MKLPPWALTILNRLNDLLHKPYVEPLSWYAFWAVFACITPLIALPALLVMFMYELLTGAWIPRYEEARGRAILVTGCDTGFGHEVVLQLYKKGWKVYAGCRSPDGARALSEKAGNGLTAVVMDVTNQQQVDGVARRIEKEVPEGLFALVNNAGIGKAQVGDWSNMDEFRQVMEVNYFAVIGVTKACLPLLKRSKGRVVVVSSIADIHLDILVALFLRGIMFGVPGLGAYAASKHAVEVFTCALRWELSEFGVRVVSVNPAFHKTSIATDVLSTLPRDFKRLPDDVRSEYGEQYYNGMREILHELTDGCWNPSNVVNALERATLSVKPPEQVFVGIDAKFSMMPLLFLPISVIRTICPYFYTIHLKPACVLNNAKVKGGNGAKVPSC